MKKPRQKSPVDERLFTATINGTKTLVSGGIAGDLHEAIELAKRYWPGTKYCGDTTELMQDGMNYYEGKTLHCFKKK